MSQETIDAKYADRAATPEEIGMARQAAFDLLPGVQKPVVAFISALDVRLMYASKVSPEDYMQLILAALKDAGAPVEGTIKLRLAHGAVARVRPNLLVDQGGFRYMWLAEEYVAAIAKGGL